MAQKQGRKWIVWASIAVVVVLAGVGTWWWLGTRGTDTSGQSTVSEESAPADTQPEQITKPEEQQTSGYLVLGQWNVRFKLNSDIGVVTYTVNGDTVTFSNEEFESIDPACNGKDGKTPFGTLTRSATAPQPGNTRNGDFVKKVGDQHYKYTAPTTDCSDKTDVREMARELLPSFKESINRLEAAPQPEDQ